MIGEIVPLLRMRSTFVSSCVRLFESRHLLCTSTTASPIHLTRCLHTSGRETSSSLREEAWQSVKRYVEPGAGRKVIDRYSEVGALYDKHLASLNYTSPDKMTEAAASILKDKFDAKILDVAAGSGLGGESMVKGGYTNLDAVDAAEGLLEVARGKKIYNQVVCQFLGDEKLQFEDNTYDMAVLSGAIAENQLPASVFEDLIRVVKPGGHIVNVFREEALHVPWYNNDLEGYFSRLESEGKWKLISKEIFPGFIADLEGVTFIHQIL